MVVLVSLREGNEDDEVGDGAVLASLREGDEDNEIGDGGREHGGQCAPLHTEQAQAGEGRTAPNPAHQLLHPFYLPRDGENIVRNTFRFRREEEVIHKKNKQYIQKVSSSKVTSTDALVEYPLTDQLPKV